MVDELCHEDHEGCHMSCTYVMVNTYMSSVVVMCICHSDTVCHGGVIL